MHFEKLNKIAGLIVFAIATMVYVLTIEDTASFWDCGEFIAVSYKLMVPHPPGAPFFLLIGRIFSFLAFGDVLKVAYWINMVSALSSSGTILFLFWTISYLAQKIIVAAPDKEYTLPQTIAILAASGVGSLAYTFSDSFWFSATEAEVYGMSSFFTAFVVWAILRWERIDNEAAGNRWLLLISYMMGLSIGVHLLNLLTIPALGLVYYFKKTKKISQTGMLIAVGISFGILMFINGIIPTLPSMAANFEITFVNTLGTPRYTGIIFFIGLILAALYWTFKKSITTQNALMNTAVLGVCFILIGYASYTMVLIRSNMNTPIDENNPEDVLSFVSYLKREQYGDRPLLYGPHFMSEKADMVKGDPQYRLKDDYYEVYDYKTEAVYDSREKILFPRVYSSDPNHVQLYRQKLGMGENARPTMGDNIRFFLSHQLGHMYLRYFMWNFSGRDGNDKEAGFLHIFSPTKVSEEVAMDKARDNFYMIPLVLGIVGMFFQYRKHKNGWMYVMFLFIMMGVALVVFLNSPPVEPRERDYVYVGSFYAFSIWIGFGVLAIYNSMMTLTSTMVSSVVAASIGFTAPLLMGVKGWDNHDRSGRYMSVDQARNTLASCAPNAILFTGGDNDTFPLWYVQDVEGFRTDVRVVVLSYLSTDWYINQMKMKMNDSEPLPITLEENAYIQGINDYLPVYENERSNPIYKDLKEFMSAVKKGKSDIKVPMMDGTASNVLPYRSLKIAIDSSEVASKNLIPKGKSFAPNLEIKVKGSYILKSDLVIMDLIANSTWERPLYFNNTSANTTNIDLRQHLSMEGMVYRFLPIQIKSDGETGEVDSERTRQLLSEYAYRGLDDPNAFYDDEYKKFGSGYRNIYLRLANQLMSEGKKKEAVEVLDEALVKIPDPMIPYSYYAPRFVEMYHFLDEDEKAKNLAEIVSRRSYENLVYLKDTDQMDFNHEDIQSRSMSILFQLSGVYRRAEERCSRMIDQLKLKQELTGESTTEEMEALKKRQEYFAAEFQKMEGQVKSMYNYMP